MECGIKPKKDPKIITNIFITLVYNIIKSLSHTNPILVEMSATVKKLSGITKPKWPLTANDMQRYKTQIERIKKHNEDWSRARDTGAPVVHHTESNVVVQQQTEQKLLGDLQNDIFGRYSDFDQANNVWTNFMQMYDYDTPFNSAEFTDDTGNEVDKNDVSYDQILDYWKGFIDNNIADLEVDTRQDGGRKSSKKKSTKKKSKKSIKKKSKKARQSRKARRNY
jgi:hypothetical protein